MKVLRSLLLPILLLGFSASHVHAFKFDVWIAGISIQEAYNIAKYQGIQLRKSQYSGTPALPLLSREYDDVILDEPAEVVLFFTPLSKQLFRVYVTWNRNPDVKQIPEEKINKMFNELVGVLSKKYEKGSSIINSSLETNFECRGSVQGLAHQLRIKRSKHNIDLLQSVPCNWLTLTYRDINLSRINFLELQKKQQAPKSDYKKF